MNRALGLVEVYGLLAAVTAADAMVKSANVELIGYELARGSGMATVKVEGDVGAVQAAVASGEAVARDMQLFRGKRVIARPAEGLEMLVYNGMTVGCEEDETPPDPEPEPVKTEQAVPEKKPAPQQAEQPQKKLCNLCLDPACPRKPGQAHRLCIHISDPLPGKE